MKKIVSLLIALMGLQNAVASGESVIDIQFGNGVQSLNYDPTACQLTGNGSASLGEAEKMWGFNVGGVYNRYYGKGFGFQAGVRLYLYRSNCQLDSTEQYRVNDPVNGMDYVRTVSYSNWTEQQNNLLLAIPVGGAYKKRLSEKLDLYAGLGVELLLPISSRYKVKEGDVAISGYYEDYDVDFSNLPAHNFNVVNEHPKGKNTLKVGLAGYIDAGFRYNFGVIYGTLGAYFSCGITDMSDGDSTPLFDANNAYSGIVNSNAVDGTRPLAFGLKLGIGLPAGR